MSEALLPLRVESTLAFTTRTNQLPAATPLMLQVPPLAVLVDET